MSKKIRAEIKDNYRNKDFEGNYDFMSVDDIKKNYGKVDYITTSTEHYFEFSLGTPSNQSFIIFGGMYDPKTGILYGTLNKNKESVIIFDAVEVFSSIFNNKITLKQLTDTFIKYKLTGDLEELSLNLTKRSGSSVIYKNLIRDHVKNIDNPCDLIVNTCLRTVASIIHFVILSCEIYNHNNKNKEYINIKSSYTMYKIFAFSTKKAKYLNETSLYKSCTSLYLKNEDSLSVNADILHDKSKLHKSILKANIEDLYGTKETLVYSSDPASTLRRNGFSKYITKNNVKDIRDSDTDNTYYKSLYDLNLEYDYMQENINVGISDTTYNYVSENVQQLIYLNKTFRKLSK